MTKQEFADHLFSLGFLYNDKANVFMNPFNGGMLKNITERQAAELHSSFDFSQQIERSKIPLILPPSFSNGAGE